MAKGQCSKGTFAYQCHSKRRAISWCLRKKSQAWFLAFLFFPQGLFSYGIGEKSAFRLESKDLKVSGARYFLQVFEQIPKLNILQTSKLLFILDGQKISDPLDQEPFWYLPVEVIDYIDVFYGPQGIFYDGSLMGTIDIHTKKNRQNKFYSYYEIPYLGNMGFLFNEKFSNFDNNLYGFLWLKDVKGMINNNFSFEIFKNHGFYLQNNARFIFDEKIIFQDDLHLIEKNHQTERTDIFIKSGVFKGEKNYKVYNFEGGIKYHFKPILTHNLYLGSGSVILGVNDFKVYRANFYAFAQDEWQIKPPFTSVLGVRSVLPLEQKKMSLEILPHIGMQVIPDKKWGYSISFNSSFRPPSFKEVFLAEDPKLLDYERGRSIKTTFFLNDRFDLLLFKNDFALDLTKIDEAVDFNDKNKLNNANEIDVISLSWDAKIAVNENYNFDFGINFSWSYKKEFDEKGYAKCKAGLYNIFSTMEDCKNIKIIPPISAYVSSRINLLVYGDINIYNSLKKFKLKNGEIKYDNNLNLSYHSKLMWKYFSFYFGVSNLFGQKLFTNNENTKFFLGFSVSD